MILIDPNTIYAAGELETMFRAHGARWCSLRDRMERAGVLRKVTDAGWLGSDILQGLREAPQLPRVARKAARIAQVRAGFGAAAPVHTPETPVQRRRGRPCKGLVA